MRAKRRTYPTKEQKKRSGRKKSLSKDRPEYHGISGFFRAGAEGLRRTGQKIESFAERGTLHQVEKASEKIVRRTAFGLKNTTERIMSLQQAIKEQRQQHFANELERLRAKERVEQLKLNLAKEKAKLGRLEQQREAIEAKAGPSGAQKLGSKLWTYLNTDYDNPKNNPDLRKKVESS